MSEIQTELFIENMLAKQKMMVTKKHCIPMTASVIFSVSWLRLRAYHETSIWTRIKHMFTIFKKLTIKEYVSGIPITSGL